MYKITTNRKEVQGLYVTDFIKSVSD